MNTLEAIFYSKVRAQVFRLLFGIDAKKMYISEIASVTKFANRSVEEELNKLKKLDLLVSTPDRSRNYYAANQAHPLYVEIRNIVIKTSGLKDLLHDALRLAPIDFAFVFGSLAASTERAESDVDLMIIGQATHRDLASPLRALNDQLGREINPHFISRGEFTRRITTRDHFLSDVLSKPKLFIIGDENEFTDMAKVQMAGSPPDLA